MTLTYMGRLIHRNTEPGYRLRYNALGIGAADTLAGIKRLIRNHDTIPAWLHYGTAPAPCLTVRTRYHVQSARVLHNDRWISIHNLPRINAKIQLERETA